MTTEDQPILSTTLQTCLDEYVGKIGTKQELMETIKKLNGELRDVESSMLDLMLQEDLKCLPLGGEKVLRVEKKLKAVKKDP